MPHANKLTVKDKVKYSKVTLEKAETSLSKCPSSKLVNRVSHHLSGVALLYSIFLDFVQPLQHAKQFGISFCLRETLSQSNRSHCQEIFLHCQVVPKSATFI